MKEELSIDIIGLAGACSYALDCIEAELVNIKNKHGKRVAYISICMAEYWKIEGDELQDLAMCALLHDNALTQYISEELKKDSVINCKKDLSEKKTNLHCIYGEKNISHRCQWIHRELFSGRCAGAWHAGVGRCAEEQQPEIFAGPAYPFCHTGFY